MGVSFIGGKSLSAEGAPLSAGVRSEGAVPPRNPIATRYDENVMLGAGTLGAVTQTQFRCQLSYFHENGKFWPSVPVPSGR